MKPSLYLVASNGIPVSGAAQPVEDSAGSEGTEEFESTEVNKATSGSKRSIARKAKERTESPPSDVPVLRRAAMDFLARREHSFYELSQKLLTKFPDASVELVDQVLSRLRMQNLQSDQRFTDAYVRYRKSKGFGYLHIKSDLVQRKVPMMLINSYLFEDDSAWTEIALDLVNRRLGYDTRLEFGSKQHLRLSRYLVARGFSQQESRQVLALRID